MQVRWLKPLRQMFMNPSENEPRLWQAEFPRPSPTGHKYDRGNAVIFAGGLESAGAARLAARAALRSGAGLVTLAVPSSALLAHAGSPPDALMIRRSDGSEGWKRIVEDTRCNAILIGPAFGVGNNTRQAVEIILNARRACVIDADALTSFAGTLPTLTALINRSSTKVILTPHEGEFARLFNNIPMDLARLERTQNAARHVNAIVVLKGPKTIIASPCGRTVINNNAPADLASAGSGDVLAGIITGLLAQGMPAFEAACAAVWLHSEAGRVAGIGLIADDLPEALSIPLTKLRTI
jgi:ADP-dependent NAD(P)H-hydrate dehydratase / NAD(P)H-hydrate epimerase